MVDKFIYICLMLMFVVNTESEKFKNHFLKQKYMKIYLFKETNMVNHDMIETHPHNTGWNNIS